MSEKRHTTPEYLAIRMTKDFSKMQSRIIAPRHRNERHTDPYLAVKQCWPVARQNA
jgi:hypothetical protein